MVSRLLWQSSLRFMRQQYWQTALSFIAITLGVAIVVAVDLANESARMAFDWSVSGLDGQVSHQIVANSGVIDEALFVNLRKQLGITRSAPQLEARIQCLGESFSLLGIDPISELSLRRHAMAIGNEAMPQLMQQANGVILLRQTADRLGLKTADDFICQYRGKPLQLKLSSTLAQAPNPAFERLIITDIANAQHMLGRRGELDKIALELNDAELQAIKTWLPPRYRLIDTQRRHGGVSAMSQAFHHNLTAMRLLVLLVGGLLIYNAMTFSALRRQRVIGIYRALGLSRRELITLLLVESVVVAVPASFTGLALGLALSQYLLHLEIQTIDDLYFRLTVSGFVLSPASLLKGMILGVFTSVLATLSPAMNASRVAVINLQRRSATEQHWQVRYKKIAVIGAAGFVGLYLYEQLPTQGLTSAYIALILMVFSFCLLTPLALSLSCRILEKLVRPWSSISLRLAIRGVAAGISRSGIAVASLAVALATVMAMTIMIASFRFSVDTWLTQSLSGDVHISMPKPPQDKAFHTALIDDLRRLDEVGHISSRRSFRGETQAGRLRIVSIENRLLEHYPPLLAQVDSALQRYIQGQGIFISEPLAYHQHLQAGDLFSLYTQEGLKAFTVLAIFRDYSSSRGIVSVAPALLQKYWPAQAIDALTLRRSESSSYDELLTALKTELAKQPGDYPMVSIRTIRERSLAIFDRTFAITQVVDVLLLIVAFIGLLSALLALQLEKSSEYAIYRAIGMSRLQLAALILQQTCLLGFSAALLAMPLGFLLAQRLIHVINRRSFGWSMEQVFPVEILPQSLLLAIIAALLAAIYPIAKMWQKTIASALREE